MSTLTGTLRWTKSEVREFLREHRALSQRVEHAKDRDSRIDALKDLAGFEEQLVGALGFDQVWEINGDRANRLIRPEDVPSLLRPRVHPTTPPPPEPADELTEAEAAELDALPSVAQPRSLCTLADVLHEGQLTPEGAIAALEPDAQWEAQPC